MRFIKSLQFIFKPSYWIMNYSYNYVWDYMLNNLLDKYDFTNINRFTAKLGDLEIWIENQPYATMRPCDCRLRASRLTIQRAIRKFQFDHLKQEMKTELSKCVRAK